MSLLFRFPYRWGAGATVTPEPEVASVETWVRVAAVGGNWQQDEAGTLPRFEHIFPGEGLPTVWTKESA